MISYELALRLKNAGFPQTVKGWPKPKKFCKHDLEPSDGGHIFIPKEDWQPKEEMDKLSEREKVEAELIYLCLSEEVIKPTLEELIAACGRRFFSLHNIKQDGSYPMKEGFNWRATSLSIEGFCEGETPEIAVAHLWLALNKK